MVEKKLTLEEIENQARVIFGNSPDSTKFNDTWTISRLCGQAAAQGVTLKSLVPDLFLDSWKPRKRGDYRDIEQFLGKFPPTRRKVRIDD
jgi:hypothetical protein